MAFSLSYRVNPRLAQRAWLAVVDQAARTVEITCGVSVERRPGFMAECVWDGPFTEGGFHRAEHVFGTGVRVEGDAVHLVPPSFSVDRVMACRWRGRWWASNSLVLLLGATGAQLNDRHPYWTECLSVLKGVENYRREYAVVHPEIEHFWQVFYENLVITPDGVEFHQRDRLRRLGGYGEYMGALRGVLRALWDNARDPARRVPIFGLSNLSTGYDSTAATALVGELGIKESFGGAPIRRPLRRLLPPRHREDPRPIARALGVRLHLLDPERSSVPEDELYFLATNYAMRHSGHWSELTFHSMAADIEARPGNGLVFSGLHGDIIWDVAPEARYIDVKLRRPCTPGLNLTEIRLKAGFVLASVPFLLANNISDVIKITGSPEMEPWRLHNDYDRPIPRRIAEEAGVPRAAFGMHKDMITQRYIWPVNPVLRRAFFRWLWDRHGLWWPVLYAEHLTETAPALAFLAWRGLNKQRKDYWLLDQRWDLYYLMTHWATEILARRAARALGLAAP